MTTLRLIYGGLSKLPERTKTFQTRNPDPSQLIALIADLRAVYFSDQKDLKYHVYGVVSTAADELERRSMGLSQRPMV